MQLRPANPMFPAQRDQGARGCSPPPVPYACLLLATLLTPWRFKDISRTFQAPFTDLFNTFEVGCRAISKPFPALFEHLSKPFHVPSMPIRCSFRASSPVISKPFQTPLPAIPALRPLAPHHANPAPSRPSGHAQPPRLLNDSCSPPYNTDSANVNP